ncbi:MAG: UDP-N-acetylglucosamine/UDP-N-acetylgalactosamine diphosphorylase [Planctomycetota bacterium]|jgi:UDP-N-acetylglucosamine/UDP-N-acetylgalactosamine diphosphorylase
MHETPKQEAQGAKQLIESWRAAGQGHVFAFWEQLSDGQRAGLLGQLAQQDLEQIQALGKLVREDAAPATPSSFEPAPVFPLERDAEQLASAEAARALGAERLAAGKVGYVLVAGGQGSRLGYDGPKGEFPVGPLTGASLFAWHAARLAAASKRHGSAVRWYVMTSQANDAATRAFFERNDDFGLGADSVMFFTQAMLPALDLQGRVILASPSDLFLAPNGHGGTLEALHNSGALADAAARGIETFSYFQVDNPLARPADPLFLGLHAQAGADMSSKVVPKRDPGEKVGVLGLADGVLGCIEYSDLPAELRDATDRQGRLVFNAGNIAKHAIERSFVERLTADGLDLPWHLARKSMASIDAQGQPTKIDGVKFETFVFDALHVAKNSVTLEVERAKEFSPVKNAEGQDSPASCRADLVSMFADWIASTPGAHAPPEVEGQSAIEVAPTFAEDAEEFASRARVAPKDLAGGHHYA